eukprot:2960169-Alexandrium_andersonii.AAC.1
MHRSCKGPRGRGEWMQHSSRQSWHLGFGVVCQERSAGLGGGAEVPQELEPSGEGGEPLRGAGCEGLPWQRSFGDAGASQDCRLH